MPTIRELIASYRQDPDISKKIGRTKGYVLDLLADSDIAKLPANQLSTVAIINHCRDRNGANDSVSGREDLKWADTLLADLDKPAAAALFAEYQRRLTRNTSRSANIWLRKTVEQVRQYTTRFPVPIHMLNSEKKRESVSKEWAGVLQLSSPNKLMPLPLQVTSKS